MDSIIYGCLRCVDPKKTLIKNSIKKRFEEKSKCYAQKKTRELILIYSKFSKKVFKFLLQKVFISKPANYKTKKI